MQSVMAAFNNEGWFRSSGFYKKILLTSKPFEEALECDFFIKGTKNHFDFSA
jgi:hypothetical protein